MTNQPFQPYPLQPGQPAPTPGVVPRSPKKHHAWGLIISLIIFIMLFIIATTFAVWTYVTMLDYKNNSDQKLETAVAIAVKEESSRKDTEFIEKEKFPLAQYLGPNTFGSLDISYPKTWSAFVTESDKANVPVDAYFHPGFVPGIQSGTSFALRVQVTNQSYDQVLKAFEPKVKTNKVRVSAYVPKNVAGITGSRLEGEIETGQQAVMVLIPLRDKTIKLSTEAQQFVGDFNSIVLEHLKFVP